MSAESRQKHLKKLAERDAGIRKLILQSLMGTVDGRRFVWRELEELNVFAPVFTDSGSGAALAAAFRDGKRQYGVRLLTDVTRWCAKDFVAMMVENTAVEMETEENGRPDPDTAGA
jgi:hypothetical protein